MAGEHHLTVVTGAPNIAQGQNVALALVGAELWDGHSEEKKRLKLKASSIRGVPSGGHGLLREGAWPLGRARGDHGLAGGRAGRCTLRDYLGDAVFELEITPNLVHDFSVVGVARKSPR